VLDFLKRYQARATSAGVDALGYFLPPWAYARMQLMAQAIEGSESIDDGKLADYFHSHTFKTIIGDVAFGMDGEWAAPRPLWTQFRQIKGKDLEQFKDPSTEVILLPRELQSGTLIWPYGAASSSIWTWSSASELSEAAFY
jgi:branched-chain amino acid transport system substrate-binding protein